MAFCPGWGNWKRWWSTGTGITPGVDSLPSAVGLGDLQKDLWPLKLELQSLAIWAWVFDQRLHPTGFLEESEIKHLSSVSKLENRAQTLWILRFRWSATESSQLPGLTTWKIEMRKITKDFFTQKKIQSHLPDWLSFSHSASHWKGRQEKPFFIPSFIWDSLCLALPFSYRSFDQRILVALSYYFYFLQEVYNFSHQIKLFFSWRMFSVSVAESYYYFSSPLRPVKSWMLCLVLGKNLAKFLSVLDEVK